MAGMPVRVDKVGHDRLALAIDYLEVRMSGCAALSYRPHRDDAILADRHRAVLDDRRDGSTATTVP